MRKKREVVRCTCLVCKKEFSNVGIITHMLRSHDNDARFSTSGHIGQWQGSNQYIKAKNLGLPAPKLSEKTRKALSDASIKHNSEYWTQEHREKHSDTMLQAVKDNPNSYNYDNVCRRVERFVYGGQYFHSSWEVVVAKYLDENDICWTRKVESFDYIFNGKIHQYFPDFYLPDLDLYLEVKGYKIDRDDAKWNSFPKKLQIILEIDIKNITLKKFTLGA